MCFLYIDSNMLYNVVYSDLLSGGIDRSWCNKQDYAGGLPSLQLEAREPSGGICSVHYGKSYMGELGQPSFLVVINVVSDGLVHGFVCLFTASISLGVVGG